MGIGAQLQQALLDRAIGYFLLAWVVTAICVGLLASETKKRRFWVWFVLSFLTGPIAWYVLFFKLGIPVPKELAVTCRHCGKQTRSDEKRCLFCKKLLAEDQPDRAAQIGQTAATMVFTAKTLFGRAKRVADDQRVRRERQKTSGTGER